MQPLLECDRARVDVHGVPAVDGLTLQATGEHALVIGAPRALFEAASGVRAPVRGEVRVGGERAVEALRARIVAGAPLDAPLPPKWTPREYATWSARLVGHARTVAAALAREAIERMKMTGVADSPLGKAPPIVRRATAIAAALATGAEIVALDDPMAGLPVDQARALGRIVVRALEDRRWIVFAARVPLASPLALEADEALVLAGSSVAGQGPPAELAARERSYALAVEGETAAFARRVAAEGAKVGGTTQRITIDLGELTTRDLMRIALETNVVIVELLPLSASFA